jgi:hypothetical protein
VMCTKDVVHKSPHEPLQPQVSILLSDGGVISDDSGVDGALDSRVGVYVGSATWQI